MPSQIILNPLTTPMNVLLFCIVMANEFSFKKEIQSGETIGIFIINLMHWSAADFGIRMQFLKQK